MKRFLVPLVVLTFFPAAIAAQELPLARTRVEVGFLDPLSHTIQFGSDGTEIDYIDEGGQDVLFPFFRASFDVLFGSRHRIGFLYQPLALRGEVVLGRDWVIDEQTFQAGTAVDASYGFPFYRLSYTYDLSPFDDVEFAFGGGLQLRNATIAFTSADGSMRHVERDVGPVPVLKMNIRKDFANWFIETEWDGFYAPIKYLNGGASDVVGAIADINLRYGYLLGNTEAYLNLRYLGGGAEGTSDDSFTKNWLHFATISVGFSYYL